MAQRKQPALKTHKKVSAGTGFGIVFIGIGILAIPLVAWYIANHADTGAPLQKNALRVNTREANAFGSLVAASSAKSTAESAQTAVDLDTPSAAPSNDSTGSLIAPDIYPSTYYRYVYASLEGDVIPMPGSTVTVLKRTPGTAPSAAILVNAASFNIADLSSFADATLQTASFVQQKTNGYLVNVDFVQGMVSINEYWPMWKTAAEFNVSAPTLSDAELIAITDRFLTEHGISKASYGTPAVQRSAQDIIAMREAGTTTTSVDIAPWHGGSATVVYPLYIQGQMVVEQSGEPVGITVTVNTSEKRVSSVYNVASLAFDSSAYDAVTNEQSVIDAATRVSSSVPDDISEDATVVEITLGLPEQVLLHMYRYDDETGQSEEVLVPAFRFPVVEAPTDDSLAYQQAVVIPLAQELLDAQYGGGEPVPLPAVIDGSSGAGEVGVSANAADVPVAE